MSKDTYMNYCTNFQGTIVHEPQTMTPTSHLAQWASEIKFALFVGRAWLP